MFSRGHGITSLFFWCLAPDLGKDLELLLMGSTFLFHSVFRAFDVYKWSWDHQVSSGVLTRTVARIWNSLLNSAFLVYVVSLHGVSRTFVAITALDPWPPHLYHFKVAAKIWIGWAYAAQPCSARPQLSGG